MAEPGQLAVAETSPVVEPEPAVTPPLERRELIALLGTLKFTVGQRRRLAEPVDEAIVAIKPTGEPYVPAVFYRRKLNALFLSWGLRPLQELQQDLRTDAKRSIVYREYALMINGLPASVATGEAEYHPSNDRMSLGDAVEAVRSNALMRLCKDLGLFSECWDPAWSAQWRERYCVQVWVDRKRGGENKPQWRRLDAAPFYGEDRPTDESPNRAQWFEQHAQRRRAPASPDPVAPVPPTSGQPERITALRTLKLSSGATAYGLKTTVAEYFFDDQNFYAQLDQLRLQGVDVRCRWEDREQQGRKYRWLIEVSR